MLLAPVFDNDVFRPYFESDIKHMDAPQMTGWIDAKPGFLAIFFVFIPLAVLLPPLVLLFLLIVMVPILPGLAAPIPAAAFVRLSSASGLVRVPRAPPLV
jgi:hypothetical protein